jgi:hypothetical protein
VDKRKAWREQEQRLVERWNAAAARQRDVHAEISRLPPAPDNAGPSADLLLRAEAARAEIEALRRQIARLKVEFNSGKRY